jgi:hypothetical protein
MEALVLYQFDDGERSGGSRCVRLLNGQTTKRDSIASEGEGLFTVNTAGVKDRGPLRQVEMGHVPKVFMGPIRSFHDLLRQKRPSLKNCVF